MADYKTVNGWRTDQLLRRSGTPRPNPPPQSPQVANAAILQQMQLQGVRRPGCFDIVATALTLFCQNVIAAPLLGIFGPKRKGLINNHWLYTLS